MSDPPIAPVILAITGDLLELAIVFAADASGQVISSRQAQERIKTEKRLIIDRIFGNRRGGKCRDNQLFEASLRRCLEILEQSGSATDI